jgi:transcriptional regulator with XRE-family HTH domain
MTPLASRVQWVIDSGLVPNGSKWCEKAGVSRTYIATFLHRQRTAATDIGVETLLQLAKAAGVSPSWLAFGDGSPEDASATLPKNLQALIARLPPDTYSQVLILQAGLLRDIIGEKDLPEENWREYLDSLQREARRTGLELAALRMEQRGIKRR